jgi:hypothetical protein
MSIAALALEIKSSLLRSETDGVRLRLVRQFLMDVVRGDVASVVSLQPESTGSVQWDALLAGLAEHVAFRASVAVPAWSSASDKFLNTWWFLMPFSSLHGAVLAETPAAFANRGVFISRDSLVNI